MEINTVTHTYNTYGGSSTISRIGDYLSLELGTFGSAIEEIEVHVYVEGGVPNSNSAPIHKQYHEFTADLPSTTFYRKKKRFQINYVSAASYEAVSGFEPPCLNLFMLVIKEIAEQFKLIKSKLKKGDDFAANEFEDCINSKLNTLPTNGIVFTEILQKLDLVRQEKWAGMSEWEKLGVDWEDYHSEAKIILDDPFYWQTADDFSPHGNDSGSDAMGIYRERYKAIRQNSGTKVVNQILDDWGFSDASDEGDHESREIYFEIVLGVIFAQLKYQAKCDIDLKETALEVIQCSKAHHIKLYADWPLLDSKIQSLEMMENKLKSIETN